MPDGTKYEGEINDNLATGIGQCWYADGSYYQGFFEKNKRSGKGEFKFPGGKDHYVGEFFDNERHGEGEMHYEDGTIYKGPWERDSPNSDSEFTGIETYPNGDRFEGVFKADFTRSLGHYYFKDGT